MFETWFQSELRLIEDHLRSRLQSDFRCPLPQLERFWQSMEYSLHTGGKRFRPLLALLTAKTLSAPVERVLDHAAAVEMIHTYSLIHDDLPCMDNDDLRRGQPTNHKVYGEAGALLAGDALLTLAFGVLTRTPSLAAAQAVSLLAEAAGPRGMVGGQVMDVELSHPEPAVLSEIHLRKTGCLIRVAVEGAAVLCAAEDNQRRALRAYGELAGLAFQLADDLEDFNPNQPEKISFVSAWGLDSTRLRLHEVSESALSQLHPFHDAADGLRRMIVLNRDRV
jgi:geranylgeranyl diphosphate synthase type II